MTIERLLEWWVLASLLISLLIVFVLVTRTPVTRYLGARWAYYLWAVPALGVLGLAVPGDHARQVLSVPELQVPGSEWLVNLVAPIPAVVLLVWASGVLISLLWLLLRSTFFSLVTDGASRELSFAERQAVNQRCAGLRRHMEVDFRLLMSREGPAVSGVLRPSLLLPNDFFTAYTDHQQKLMLSHELQHLCRRDLMFLLLGRIIRCLFWFNPLVWVAERFMRLDQELSCDERVISNEPAKTRRLYGKTMLQAAYPHFSDEQVNYPPTFRQMRSRAGSLKRHRPTILGSACGAILLTLASAGGILLGAAGGVGRDTEVRPEIGDQLQSLSSIIADSKSNPSELAQLRTRLDRLRNQHHSRPLSTFEFVEITGLIARTEVLLGHETQALASYDRILELVQGWPELKARTLISKAGVYNAMGEFQEVLKTLVRAEHVDPRQYAPGTWALRGFALARMKLWDQALISLNRAVEQEESRGGRPEQDWLLAQAAFRFNQGDLDGATQAFESSRSHFPDTPFTERMEIFNRYVMDSWTPDRDEPLLSWY